MKALFRKLKRTNLSIRLIYYFILILFLVSYILFVKSLLQLTGIETTIRIVVIVALGTLLLLYGFIDLLLLLTKKYKSIIVTSVIAMLLSCVCIIGTLYINKGYSLISNMTVDDKEVTYTTDLITLTDTNFQDTSSFIIGMINNDTDIEGYTLAEELLDKEKIKNVTIKKYDTYFEMLELLYSGDIDGMFVGDSYVDTYSTYEQYEKIADETKIVYTYSKKMEAQSVIETTAEVTDPFTILLIGVDSEKSTLNFNAGFNSDTLMMVTFNPKTLSATVFSIPRDTYVPICNKGFSSKINSASAYGGACVVKTVENLTGINIDFYAMINFEGVVDLVDALGGITVDVAVPDSDKYNGQVCEQNSKRSWGSATVCMDTGVQRLNGEQALAYSRCRHLYLTSDFARIQHQQDVVEAMANELKNMDSVNDFYKALEAVSKNLVTNMSTANMLNLYNVFKTSIIDANSGSMINIQKTYLTGYNLTMIVENISKTTSVYTYQYNTSSLDEIVHALKVTLEKEKPTIIKTFSFSGNTTYEQQVIGKVYTTASKNEALPNFVGSTIEYAKSWCSARGITVSTVEVTEASSNYNASYGDGIVVTQSQLKGTLSSKISSITFGVNTKKSTTTTKKTSSSSTDDEDEDTEKTTKTTEVATTVAASPKIDEE